MTIVAPKSGSITASPINTPTISTAGTEPFQNFSMRQPAQSRKTAVEMTTKIFPSSLGCRRTGPNSRSQRCDPFVSGANSTATIRAAMMT